MGNRDAYDVERYLDNGSSQMQQHHQNEKPQRVGLTPTDAQAAAYKRSNNRASNRRSRNERISYLMATGHLDIEETRQLTGGSETNVMTSTMASSTPTFAPTANSFQNIPTQLISKKPAGSGGDGTLLQDYAQQFDNLNDNIFRHSNGKPGFRYSSNNYSKRNKKNSIPNDFAKSYTEVTLPMKTSPAFEYILQDDKRRNRRCCLWILYSTLVTICLIVITFCCVKLYQRQY